MRPCLISEWRSQPIVASWPTCVVSRGDAAAATITRTPQTRAAVGVALHAEREGHVRQAERVVEAGRARDGVLEVDEVRLGVGEDRLGRGRRRRRDEGRRHGGERERDDELHVDLRAARRSRLRLAAASRWRASRCRAAPASSQRSQHLRRGVAAACARRAVRSSSRRQQLRPAVTGQRSNVDRQRARKQSLFLAKNASALARCGLMDAGALAPRRRSLFFAVRAAAPKIISCCTSRKRAR
jgi:hypothetical protein